MNRWQARPAYRKPTRAQESVALVLCCALLIVFIFVAAYPVPTP